MIVVQADGGRYAAERDPAAAKQVLATIAGSARGALAEMRRLLGLLRSDEGKRLAPQPDVHDVVALVEHVTRSGLPVTLDVVGLPAPVDKGTGLTVYRIVQEGLTNTMKHAGRRATATVRLEYGEGRPARSSSPTTVPDRADGPAGTAPDKGCAACASASSCTAAAWPCERDPVVGSSFVRSCPSPSRTGDDDRPRSDVAIVDDQQLVRAGFRMLVDSQPDLTVVGDAGDGEEALAACRTRRPTSC